MEGAQAEAYRSAATFNGMAVFSWDIQGDVLSYDDALTRLLRRQLPRENISVHLQKAGLVHPKDRIEFRKQIRWLLTGTSKRRATTQDFEMDLRIYVPKRCYLWVHLGYRVHFVDGTPCRVEGFLQNIDLERKAQNDMRALVERDPMTGLYSKMHSKHLVEQTIADPEDVHALLVIDLDNFKQVNDKLGHLIGDTVILDMAMNLKMLFRDTDILGHIGGDEFMVLMKDIVEPKDVLNKCDRLRDLLRKSYDHEGGSVAVSASIGIAFSPAQGTDYETLFSHADAALYAGKRQGKDSQVVYSDALDVKPQEGKAIAPDHAPAAPTRRGDFQELMDNPKRYIMRKVIESKDTMLALDILLDIFMKQFQVNRAYIFWHIDGPYWPRPLFDCVLGDCKTAAKTHDARVRRQMRKRYRATKYGHFTVCRDVGKLAPMARKEFERQGICAYIECAVLDGDRFMGTVGFDDCKGPHAWAEADYEVLAALAEVMKRFLFGQIYFERMQRRGHLEF